MIDVHLLVTACVLAPAGPAKTAPPQVVDKLTPEVLIIRILSHCNVIGHLSVFVRK